MNNEALIKKIDSLNNEIGELKTFAMKMALINLLMVSNANETASDDIVISLMKFGDNIDDMINACSCCFDCEMEMCFDLQSDITPSEIRVQHGRNELNRIIRDISIKIMKQKKYY